jgi:hypothetical protein
MKTLFVSYELAVKLKEIGFNDPCFGYYTSSRVLKKYRSYEPLSDNFDGLLHNANINITDYVAAPMHQQIIDLFREYHNLFIEIFLITSNLNISDKIYSYVITDLTHDRDIGDSNPNGHSKYYDALESAMFMCIKLLKNQIK